MVGNLNLAGTCKYNHNDIIRNYCVYTRCIFKTDVCGNHVLPNTCTSTVIHVGVCVVEITTLT